jgi:hypothetical protein
MTAARGARSEPWLDAASPPPIPAAEAMASPVMGAMNAAGCWCWANMAKVTP